jgi:oligopeptide/dipeptide ABC transporter ATP-binding protein
MNEKQLLSIEDLTLHFRTSRGIVRAVDQVNFELGFNEAVVVLGESGCGKSSLAKAILRLLPKNTAAYSGKVTLNGTDIMRFNEEEFRKNVRWHMMSMVPQAAMNALNPVLKIGEQVAEPVLVHSGLTKQEGLMKAKKMFEHVGVPEEFLQRYAFELSGGMRQRAAIAMALVTSPDLIILDEPTSALDVLTQANIFNVLKALKRDLEMSYILITHDIATSSELADKVAVMYAGQIVEVSDATRFFTKALHPYSRKLMDSVPRLRGDKEPDFITGQPPSLLDPPTGCRFKERCPVRMSVCDQEPPVFREDGRLVKCWLYQKAVNGHQPGEHHD